MATDNPREIHTFVGVLRSELFFSGLRTLKERRGPLRSLLDRLRRITRHDAGKSGITDKRAVGICVAGGGGGGAPACAVSLEKVLATCGFDVVDMIPVRKQNLDMKLDVLKVTGKWLAGGSPAKAK